MQHLELQDARAPIMTRMRTWEMTIRPSWDSGVLPRRHVRCSSGWRLVCVTSFLDSHSAPRDVRAGCCWLVRGIAAEWAPLAYKHHREKAETKIQAAGSRSLSSPSFSSAENGAYTDTPNPPSTPLHPPCPPRPVCRPSQVAVVTVSDWGTRTSRVMKRRSTTRRIMAKGMWGRTIGLISLGMKAGWSLFRRRVMLSRWAVWEGRAGRLRRWVSRVGRCGWRIMIRVRITSTILQDSSRAPRGVGDEYSLRLAWGECSGVSI